MIFLATLAHTVFASVQIEPLYWNASNPMWVFLSLLDQIVAGIALTKESNTSGCKMTKRMIWAIIYILQVPVVSNKMNSCNLLY